MRHRSREQARQLVIVSIRLMADAVRLLKADPFFAGVDFLAVDERRIQPPQEPVLLPAGDASRFDEYRPRDCPEDDVDASKINFAGF